MPEHSQNMDELGVLALMREFLPMSSSAIKILERLQSQNPRRILRFKNLIKVAEYTQTPLVDLLREIRQHPHLKASVEAKNLLQVCCNRSCEILGQGELVVEVERILGINAGHTTEDGNFHLHEVECTGLCDKAPMLNINGVQFEDVRIDELQQILNSYRLIAI